MKVEAAKVKSKFYTIGFTKDHDAAYLNDIAKAGSELGNFIYIDTSIKGYKDLLDESLKSSLAMSVD